MPTPPPAYEISQEQFDDKTLRVMTSLDSASESRPTHCDEEGLEEGLETWDAEGFRTRTARWVHDPHQPVLAYPESRPSSLLSRSDTRPPRGPRKPSFRQGMARWNVMNQDAFADERSITMSPPPVFTPIGPSLDGPAYEEVVLTHRDQAGYPPECSPSRDALFDLLPEASSSQSLHSLSPSPSVRKQVFLRREMTPQPMSFAGAFIPHSPSLSQVNQQPPPTSPSLHRSSSPAAASDISRMRQDTSRRSISMSHTAFDPNLVQDSTGDAAAPRKVHAAALAFYSPAVSAQMSNTMGASHRQSSRLAPRYSLDLPRRQQ